MYRFITLGAISAALMAAPVSAQELQNQSGDFVDATTGLDLTIEIDPKESSTVIAYGGFVGGKGSSDLTWSLSAEFPIGGKDSLVSGNTLDSLKGGPKVSFALNFLFADAGGFALDTPRFKDINQRAVTACLAAAGEKAAAGTFSAEQHKDEAAKCRLSLDYPTEDFVRNHLPGAELEMNRVVLGGYSTLGLEGSLGTAKADFVTPGTLAEGSKRQMTWSLAGTFAYFGSDAVSAYKFGAEFSRAPEELDKEVVCKTVVVTPADDCVNALSRAPNLEDSLVFKSELRRFFPFRNGKGGIGAALTGGYDVLSDEWEAELPIYFAIPGKSPVLPGISLGYKSKTDKFAVGVFLKTAFKF